MNETRLDELIESMDAKKTEFYKKAIELHNDERLRDLAKYTTWGIEIVDNLKYTEKGFMAMIIRYAPGPDEHGRYHGYYYYTKNNKLMVKGPEGKEEMLERFPQLTINTVVNAIEQGIQKSRFYGGNQNVS